MHGAPFWLFLVIWACETQSYNKDVPSTVYSLHVDVLYWCSGAVVQWCSKTKKKKGEKKEKTKG